MLLPEVPHFHCRAYRHVIKGTDHPGKWSLLALTWPPLWKKGRQTKKGLFFFQLAAPVQTWQWQVMCFRDQFYRFPHSGICFANTAQVAHVCWLANIPPANVASSVVQMEWHISGVGPWSQMHQSFWFFCLLSPIIWSMSKLQLALN